MKKLYTVFFISLLSFCKAEAQRCSVNIDTLPKTARITCKEPLITLTARTNGYGSIKYDWNAGPNTAQTIDIRKDSLTGVNDSLYRITITDDTGCVASATVRITKDIGAPSLTAYAVPASICPGDSSNLVVFGPDSLRWNPDSLRGNFVTVRPTATATFTVTGVASNGCTADKSITVNVRPLPSAGISISGSTNVCLNTNPPQIKFSGTNGTKPYTFTFSVNDIVTQLITVKTSSDTTINAPTSLLGSFRYKLISVTDSNGCAQPQGGTVVYTVGPGPALTTPQADSVCDGLPFNYTAVSSPATAIISWTRPFVPGITPLNATGGRTINETLRNATTQPIPVSYVFTLTNGNFCTSTETVRVTVLPTPRIDSLRDTTFCSGISVAGIPFKTASPNPNFTWSNNNIGIGLPDSGSGNIPVFIATNNKNVRDSATITVYVKASPKDCQGASRKFKIKVDPAPQRPNFTSLSAFPNGDTLRLCNGSQNINFNVNTADTAVRYKWSSFPLNRSAVLIRDTAQPNTVITFKAPDEYKILVRAERKSTGCADSVFEVVKVDTANGQIGNGKIFRMQPGDLLVYPDNSFKTYQWGYDSVANGASIGLPRLYPGQVRQFFIPPASVDTGNRWYWVLLENAAGCKSRVYYNGPYANRLAQVAASDNAVSLQILPNPNNGAFSITVKGSIYGKLEAKIYNALGHVVYRKNLVKTVPETSEAVNTNRLPAGLYYLELISSDFTKVVTRFVIQ